MPKARKITGRSSSGPSASSVPAITADRLLGDIRALIEAAREQTARAVNSALVGLYWHIGKRIRQDILQEKRAEYGERIVSALSAQLTAEYGRRYTEKSLRRMIQFAERFQASEIVATLSRQLSLSHFVELMLDDTLKRGSRVGRTMLRIVRPTDRHRPRGGPHRDLSRLEPPYFSPTTVACSL
jgi:DUF1016 N-terminal domain